VSVFTLKSVETAGPCLELHDRSGLPWPPFYIGNTVYAAIKLGLTNDNNEKFGSCYVRSLSFL